MHDQAIIVPFTYILLAAKGKKSYAKQGALKRYPSDNSLSKKTRIPPISQPKDQKGYLMSYQATHGWSENDLTLNGQISPTGASPNGLYNKQLPPGQFNQTHPPIATYQSHIPHHPPVYSGAGSPAYAPQQSPIYGGGMNGYNPAQFQGYDMQYAPQAPNSGGYHHHQRADQPHPQMESPGQQRQGYPNHYQASYGPTQGQQYQQPGVPQQHPAYDYSGYMNNYRPADQVSVEVSLSNMDY